MKRGLRYIAPQNLKRHTFHCTAVPVSEDARHPPQVQDISAEAGAAPSFELVEAVHYWEVPIASAGPLENPVRAPCAPARARKGCSPGGQQQAPPALGPWAARRARPCRPRSAVPLAALAGSAGVCLRGGPPALPPQLVLRPCELRSRVLQHARKGRCE